MGTGSFKTLLFREGSFLETLLPVSRLYGPHLKLEPQLKLVTTNHSTVTDFAKFRG